MVEHAATKGNCVIVGRGSQQFLKDRRDTLRIFLYAPADDKVRRLLARGKSEREAEELVATVDRARGFHSEVFQRRMARSCDLPRHDQYRDWR